MSRKRPKLQPFVPLRRDMLKSPEWRSLSAKAHDVYVQMRYLACSKIKGVKIPYSSLLDMMSSQTISKALKQLRSAGFIKQIFKGGMYGSPAIYDFVGPYADPFESGRRH